MLQFSDKRWETVQKNYQLWWKGDLGRPILPCIITGREPEGRRPSAPPLSYATCNDFSITPEEIVACHDYQMSCCEYYGDAYPTMYMTHFGPGIVSAFLGAELHNDQNTVWFRYDKEIELADLHLEYDPNNIWLNHILDIYSAGMKKWNGRVVMTMPGMSGILDLLSIFRGTENLMYDLYDCEDEVLRLVGEMQRLWLRYFDDINERLEGCVGFTDWSGIYSPKPKCILQCDFAYMIGNDMFKKFVMPEIASSAKHMHRTFYHLDGVGQLAHLPDLLACDDIYGIQWVPGSGEPETQDWSEVYRTISKAGKKIQTFYNLDRFLDEVLPCLEKPDDLVKMPFFYPMNERGRALEKLSTLGVRQ